MNIIGLNAFHGDAAACLFVDGKMVAAAEEERFRRIKHWAGFPNQAIEFCLERQNLRLEDIDVIAINSDSNAARSKKLAYALSGNASLKLLREKLLVRKKRQSIPELLEQNFPGQKFSGKVEVVEHHLAHLASAYNMSPFDNATVVSVDGFGDFASSAWGQGNNGKLSLESRVYFPHSLGIFYQAMTQYLGFPHYGDEYKIMGLAPYGEPRFRAEMDKVLIQKSDGSFELDLSYFVHHRNPIGYEWENDAPKVSRLFSDKMADLLGGTRDASQSLTQTHKDIARSVQDAYERAFFNLLNNLHHRHGGKQLALAGGCGMNSVANGKIHLNTPYQDIYVQAAAGDAGGAIGAAQVAAARHGDQQRFIMSHAYWGSSYTDHEITQLCESKRPGFELSGCEYVAGLEIDELVERVSTYLCDGKVVGWFQGAMEWGPRALGNRSILGDPRRSDMKDILNLKIKRRESFRPFAPSVLRECVSDWFESDADVPFMMKVFQIREEKRALIPAVSHVDGSGRLQTVTQAGNDLYHRLISRFYEKTGIPMLLNTSFNENEPVVRQPSEALDCFLRTNMDVLVMGRQLIVRVDNSNL